MLKSVTIENVRGKTGRYEVGRITRLLGRNEVGKSTVKEAICYGFAGSDSHGTRNPRHLISTGAEGMSIVVETDKASISRTLTQKGSQSLSIIRNGVKTPCSQEQLSKALGASPDLFLSSFLPGYFMSLTEEKRRAVLSEVLPPADRLSILTGVLGFGLTPDDLITIGNLDRRPDLIAAGVAQTRRSVVAQFTQLGGVISAYSAAGDVVLQAPAPCDAESRIAAMEDLDRLWNDYNARRRNWASATAAVLATKAWNDKVASEREATERELKAVTLVPVPESVSHSAQREALYAQLKAMPTRPAFLNLPEGDRCSACGQVVGSKHREKAKADAAAALAEFEAVYQEAMVFNAGIREQATALGELEIKSIKAKAAAEDTNKILTAKIGKLNMRLAGLVPRELGDPGPEPEVPTMSYDPAELVRLRAELSSYQRAVGSYEHALKQKEEAGHKLTEAKAKLAPLALAIERYELIEAGIGKITKAELMHQAEQLTINGFTFSLEGTTVTRADGMPYGHLSTGAGLKADIMLCFKFNQLLGPKAPNVIFVDNADLIDVVPGDTPVQVFLAYVVPEIEQLVVEVG